MSHQIRPGVRGGRDQFTWDQVKEDKQRSNYLGSSIHGVPDKFKKGPETFWYAKEKATELNGSQSSEIDSIKAKEKQMMEALLGGPVDKPLRNSDNMANSRSNDRVFEKKGENRRDDRGYEKRGENRRDYRGYEKRDEYRRDEREIHDNYYRKRDGRDGRRIERLDPLDKYNRDRNYTSRESHNSRDYDNVRTRERSPRRRNRSQSRSPKMYK